MTSPNLLQTVQTDFPKSGFDRNTLASLVLILFPFLTADVFILSRIAPYMVLNAPQLSDAVLGGGFAPVFSCLVIMTMAMIRGQWFSHLVAITTAVFKIATIGLLSYSLTSPEPFFLLETGVHLVEAIFYSFIVMVMAVLNLFREKLDTTAGAFFVLAALESAKTFVLLLISNHDHSLPFDYPMVASLILYGLCLVALISTRPRGDDDIHPVFLDGHYNSSPPLQFGALFAVSVILLWTPFALGFVLSASSGLNGDLILSALVLQGGAICGALYSALSNRVPRQEQLLLALLPCLLGLALSRWLILTMTALLLAGILCGMAATASLRRLINHKDGTVFNTCVAFALIASFLLAAVLSETALVMAAPFVFKPLAMVSFAILSLTAFIDPGPRFLILSTLARILLTGTGRKRGLTEKLAALEAGPVTILSTLGFLSTLLMSLYLRYPLLVISNDGFLNLPPVKSLLGHLNVRIVGRQSLQSLQSLKKVLVYLERDSEPVETDLILERVRDTSGGGKKRAYILDAARLETPLIKEETAAIVN
ncbi:MAG: hypothetical protein H6677_07365 [Candidatus Obscuribacterales bacterium]|nr:hypothetical protein [Cyanobacteria bacterium HKST-UBA01]MCB9468083.1 hypothetical protein [Candidatus Obscuribacterales bacterium]